MISFKNLKIFLIVGLFWPILAFGQSLEQPFERNLFYGMRNNRDVGRLQQILANRGFYNGPITGNFFSLTRNAVKQFQKTNNIVPTTGYVGPLTRAKINTLLIEASERAKLSEGDIPPPSAIPVGPIPPTPVSSYTGETTALSPPSIRYPLHPPEDLLLQEYMDARIAFAKGKGTADDAIAPLRRLIALYPQSSLVDDMHLLIADTLFQDAKDTRGAITELELLKTKWPHATPSSGKTFSAIPDLPFHNCTGKINEEEVLRTPMSIIAQMKIATIHWNLYGTGSGQDLPQAIIELRKIIADYPHTKSAATAQFWLFLIYKSLGNFDKQIEENEKFISTYPNDTRVPFAYSRAGDLLIKDPINHAKIEEYAAQLAVKASPTDYSYESFPMDCNRPPHWEKKIINVTIDPLFSPEQRIAIQTAFVKWSTATDNIITFDYSRMLSKPAYFYQPDAADMYVEAIPSGEKAAAGKTVTSVNVNTIEQAMIALHSDLSLAKFAEVALHEIGHALGLWHSFNRSDIMFISSQVSDLSERDKNTIRLIYKK